MTVEILLLILGLVLVVCGADWLVDGASAIARKAGLSEFVIGLTIVGFGTSCPELVVSLTGAITGNSDISIGNVVGSNIFNTLLILGLTAVLAPIAVTQANRKRDIPLTLIVTFLLLFCGMSHTLLGVGASDSISRVEGIVFVALFIGYIIYSFKTDVPDPAVSPEGADVPAATDVQKPLALAIVMSLGGIAALIWGGDLFVNHSVNLAHMLGVSDKFIAITVLAGGTSLPELATCVVAAAKHKGQLALGNILGSNVFNILLILGCAAIVRPISLEGLNLIDAGTLALSAVAVWLWTYTGRRDRIDRWEGALMVAGFAAYYVWLFATA